MGVVRERVVPVGDAPDQIGLYLREQGDPGRPVVVLVHGYPDDSSMWDGVAEALAERFHVVRYDVRGMGRSTPPADRSGYRVEVLAADLAAVVHAVSPDRSVHLVGHDWGSIQAWEAVTESRYAPLFSSYTTISGPCLDHVAAWIRARRSRPTPANLWRLVNQFARSWYIAAFQVPALPELAWRLGLARRWHRALPDVIRGLELYRANLAGRSEPRQRHTTVPVQQIVPTGDRYVSPALVADTARWCTRFWQREIAAGHWAPVTHPRVIARWVTEFAEHIDGAALARGLARAGAGGRPHEHQLVLITGAGSGIGRATALEFAHQGATVIATDVDGLAAQRTAAEASVHGVPSVGYGLDVTDGAATAALAERVRQAHGVPDIVVANAGVGVAGDFADTTEDDWRRVVDVNLWGVVHTLRAFVPLLTDRGEGGHLVITSSAAAFLPSVGLSAYGTTKAAVLRLGENLHVALAPHDIGVSVICPGFVNTNIARSTTFVGLSAEQQEERRTQAAERFQRRNFTPERVAAAVLRAVRRNQVVVPVTPEARVGYLLSRYSPGLVRGLARRASAAAARRSKRSG